MDLGASRIGMVHGLPSYPNEHEFSSLLSCCFFIRLSFDSRIHLSGENVQSLRATSKLDCCILRHVSYHCYIACCICGEFASFDGVNKKTERIIQLPETVRP